MPRTMTVDQDVKLVLEKSTTDGPRLVLPPKLERKLYERTAKVLASCGGKWNRAAQAHVFDGDAGELVEGVLLTGEWSGQVNPNTALQFFPTPAPIVDRLINVANIELGMTVLEPSAGNGAIAWRCGGEGGRVTCIEIDPKHEATLAGIGGVVEVVIDDFLAPGLVCPDEGFDRVVMNPPFARQQDIAHVTKAFGWLKPGGMLVAVMASGAKWRENKAAVDFRALVEASGGTFVELPAGAFKASGTNVNTVMVTMEKAY